MWAVIPIVGNGIVSGNLYVTGGIYMMGNLVGTGSGTVSNTFTGDVSFNAGNVYVGGN
jgi:hypothetical protein